MSYPGKGRPVDELDTICKAYKNCLQCARMEHGETCVAEFVKYNYVVANGDVQCWNMPNSCEDSLCTCDAMFAKAHHENKGFWNINYHMFQSAEGWDPDHDCSAGSGGQGGSGGQADMKCCSKGGSAFQLYNADKKTCCPDGTVG